MRNQEYTGLAKTAWNEVAPIHWQKSHTLPQELEDPSKLFLTSIHQEELRRVGVQGAAVAQFNCNNGRELVSIARMGAAKTVGFDISEEFVRQAKIFADAADVSSEFVVSDIYEIPADYDEQFDIVVVTAGALCFMPDLEKYFEVAKRLLKPGGYLSIYESHPITEMFLKDRNRGNEPLKIVRSYFDDKPLRHTTGLDYVGGTTYDAQEIYYFHYKLDDVIMAALGLGFVLDLFRETGEDISQAFRSIESSELKPPLSYLLTLRHV
ncbi:MULTISPECIES: class I SAM-dependent methyltransferase [Rhizobium]|uniref:class I SAM-dependent methyltransferase n=1 Tax=Rhizobium TaxID=379 RepID=UPI001C82B958|nr:MULTISPECIES: class I SAM-dependent methyltransferase [Rhizobium]MBX4893831.1 class I SAM-dependent methyltransferase [Rhizobium bangladeshense]MBX5014456.1 class I SAM-dependent methyltransferase [Rhizobium lentis]